MNNEPDYKDNLYFERTNKMTQKIFDTDNADDMALLWDILPESITKLTPIDAFCITSDTYTFIKGIIKIDFHNKREITRPIQEATEADIGKLCIFWWDYEELSYFGILNKIEVNGKEKLYRYRAGTSSHCRRLTKQEVEELC